MRGAFWLPTGLTLSAVRKRPWSPLTLLSSLILYNIGQSPTLLSRAKAELPADERAIRDEVPVGNQVDGMVNDRPVNFWRWATLWN